MRSFWRHNNDPPGWLLLASFIVSLGSLVFYLSGSGFSDKTLFFLLDIIKYSVYLVFICSFYKLLICIFNIIYNRKTAAQSTPQKNNHLLFIIFYLLFIIYSVCMILIDAFILAVSGGNT